MTGLGHKLTAPAAAIFAMCLASHLHLLTPLPPLPFLPALIMALPATTAPDWLEIPIYHNGMRTSSWITHRTITHWPPLWLCLPFVLNHFLPPTTITPHLISASLGFSIGCLTHIITDSPNPRGIPWILPWKRMSPKWWKSGQYDFTIAAVLSLLAYYVALKMPPTTSPL